MESKQQEEKQTARGEIRETRIKREKLVRKVG